MRDMQNGAHATLLTSLTGSSISIEEKVGSDFAVSSQQYVRHILESVSINAREGFRHEDR